MMDSMEVQAIYKKLLDAWNERSAEGMAALFTDDGESIGFDGSQSIGKQEIFSHLKPIFDHHPTARFVSKVKDVRFLSAEIALLRVKTEKNVPRNSSLLVASEVVFPCRVILPPLP